MCRCALSFPMATWGTLAIRTPSVAKMSVILTSWAWHQWAASNILLYRFRALVLFDRCGKWNSRHWCWGNEQIALRESYGQCFLPSVMFSNTIKWIFLATFPLVCCGVDPYLLTKMCSGKFVKFHKKWWCSKWFQSTSSNTFLAIIRTHPFRP